MFINASPTSYSHEWIDPSSLAPYELGSNILSVSIFNFYSGLTFVIWVIFTLVILLLLSQVTFARLYSHFKLQLTKESGIILIKGMHDFCYFILMALGGLVLFPYILGPFFSWIGGDAYQPVTAYIYSFHPVMFWGMLVSFGLSFILKFFFNTLQIRWFRYGYALSLIAGYGIYSVGMLLASATITHWLAIGQPM